MNTKMLVALCGLALAALFSAGCLTNVPMDVTQSGKDSILPATLKFGQVRLTATLASREDTLSQMGNSFLVRTGKIYQQVFTGGEDSPYVLDVVTSRLTANTGFLTAQANYDATVTLKVGNEKHIISARGSDNTAWTIDRAARTAIEQAVIDIAAQCQLHIAAASKK